MLGRCSEGREGQACNNCQPGHYSRGSTCERCREGDALPVILVVILLLALLAFMSNSTWDPSQVSALVAQLAQQHGFIIFFLATLAQVT